jgi:hypothetical protein
MSEVHNINDKPYRDYVRIYCPEGRRHLNNNLTIVPSNFSISFICLL